MLSRNSSTSSETPLQPVFEYVPNHGPRVSIGTALCQAGFDERAVARELMQVVLQLAHPDATDRSGAKKLLVDVLKECSRQLDNSGGHRAGDAPVIVQLVHTVSRPPRAAPALTSANPGPAIDIAAPSNPDSPAAAPPTISSTEAL